MNKIRNPHLPSELAVLSETPTAHTRRWREECGSRYHQACLELAQWFWLEGKPAQAILQLNKAMMADYEKGINPARPYRALVWFLKNPAEGEFIGNPVRHFQHLATRMSGSRAELRIWRAWACFHLAQKTLSKHAYPLDHEQIEKENLALPDCEEVHSQLLLIGFEDEADLWQVEFCK